MQNKSWVLIDTETTGLAAPIMVVELAAQRMRGWLPAAEPFRRLLNHGVEIAPPVARLHGYTREILERDGEQPAIVYRDFAAYCADLPLVSFNLEFDLEQVLRPEWSRLGIKWFGSGGFCALRLAQRLLDPVPAGNCKLQTLRQYYNLPASAAHTALGDVATVAHLLQAVLRPIAEQRGLRSWADICSYEAGEWFPSRIAFGKFKGRLFMDALTDSELRGWLNWLGASTNSRTSQMGNWYLQQLTHPAPPTAHFTAVGPAAIAPTAGAGIIIYVNPEIEQLRQLIAGARSQLAEIEARCTSERHAVSVAQTAIFRLLQPHYQKLDRIRLVVEYRSRYLRILVRSGEAAAADVAADYKRARTQSETHYEEATAAASAKTELSAAEEKQLTTLWRTLVKLYHPDKFASQPDKLATYQKLTAAINQAKADGDIATLRAIAKDAAAFILHQGWTALDFKDGAEVAALRRLYEALQLGIVSAMDALSELRESADYELYQLSAKQPAVLQEVAAARAKVIDAEVTLLQAKAKELATEIRELTGSSKQPIK